MRKVALAITGLLLALGGGAHARTVPVQGPSPWCDGHPDTPMGSAVTASAGVERGRSAVGVYACYEIGGTGSRPTSSQVVRAWADPNDARAAVECVPHRDARVARQCYNRIDNPADDHRKAHGPDVPLPSPPSEAPDVESPVADSCEAPCVDVGDVVADIGAMSEAITSEVDENVPNR